MKILIVGQGFAGSLFAWFLLKNNADVTVIDEGELHSATAVAAGIMLPVTGRRLVKTYKAEEIIPCAKKTYVELEQQLGINLFTDKEILEVFSSPGNKNDWLSRSADPEYSNFMGSILSKDEMPASIINDAGGIIIKQSGFVDPLKLIRNFRLWLTKQNRFIHDKFNLTVSEMVNSLSETHFGEYSHIIFCEGFQSMSNNYFSYLPLNPAKGEILDIYSKELISDYIINKGIYILPYGDNIFRAGATYTWKDYTTNTSDTARTFLKTEIEKLIKVPFEIINHQAGIRPATIDRRPFLGFHPEYKNVGIFNGLGTKGAMLGPYYAEQMANHIVSGIQLDQDADIKRFESRYREL